MGTAAVMLMDLATARARAESLMTSTCTIRARSTATTTDADTGEVIAVPGATVYSGKCRVRPVSTRGGTDFTTPGAESFQFDYLISVPFAVTGPTEGHRVTVDASLDPALVGTEVEVQKVDRGEHITARRLACQEVA